jgi:hypothetical protein
VLGACIAENYRGHYVWRKYREELEAKGESFTLIAYAPKPVAPEQNFAATPLFESFFDYTSDRTDHEHPTRWKDKATYDRNQARAAGLGVLGSNRRKAPDMGYWQIGVFADLRPWQEYFTGNTNFPLAAAPTDPATDVLLALRRYDGVLDELHVASARPYSVFPVHYAEGYRALLPHLVTFKHVAEVSCLRALAHLQAGHFTEAFRDTQFGLRLAEALKSEPILISQFVRIRLVEMGLQPVWEGLARQCWTKEQISELQTALTRMDILGDYSRTMRTERVSAIEIVELQRTGQYKPPVRPGDDGEEQAQDFSKIRFLPGGVFCQNQFTIAWRYQESIIPLVDAVQHRVHVSKAKRVGNIREGTRYHPYSFFANLLMSQVGGIAPHFARGQAAIDLASVACGLEQHRLATGHYPDSLEALGPRFLQNIPPDLITGDLLHYRVTSGSGFVLYSVGWNERDDNGETARAGRIQRFDLITGDWVWHYAVTNTLTERKP